MNIPKESTVSGGTSKSITIRAKGTICQGGWPQMHLYINGQFVTGWTVNSSSYANYTATVTLSGQDEFDVFFANDCYAPPEDRNLFIDYVIVDGRTIQAEGGEMFRIPGYQASQLNWSGAVPGTETLASLGALRFVVGAGAFAGGYDANGNLIYRLVDGAAHTLTYDAENRLVEVKRGSTVVASYVYDHSGFRVRQTIGGTTTAFVGTYYEIGSEVTKYYFAAGVRVALRSNTQGVKYLLSDHLGSTSVTATVGGVYTRQLYTAWGEARYSSGTLPTGYTYTGQYSESYINLYWYGSRWYDDSLGRFIQPDLIIPEPYNPLAYDRYQYVYSNPVRYTDSSGHCIDGITTWACIAIIGGLVLKAIDYGWTAYDAYQSGKVLSDPNASREDKLFAALNVGLAVIFEAGEPDDLLPAGLPLDDVGRRAVMKWAREAFEKGGNEALEKFLRDNLGDYADDVLKKMDDALGISNIGFPTGSQASQLGHIFRDAPGHFANDTITNRALIMDTITRSNYMMTDKFGNQVFSRILDDGTEVWAYVRNGIIWDAGLNQVARWNK